MSNLSSVNYGGRSIKSLFALFGVTVLQLFGNTTREVIEATLLVNVSTKMVYHMVYPHIIKTDNYASITMC